MKKCPKCGSNNFRKSYDNEAFCLTCGYVYVRISQVVLDEVNESIGHSKLKTDRNKWKNSLTY